MEEEEEEEEEEEREDGIGHWFRVGNIIHSIVTKKLFGFGTVFIAP